MTPTRPGDSWARWLLERRFGGDEETMRRALPSLYEYRDTVLRGARIAPGDTVLDVGCGDGLLGAGALAEVGDSGQVIFSDISEELLEHCRQAVSELDGSTRCRFVHTGLPDLTEIPSASVDVAMTRSVLIYVVDKPAAFVALHRVLRPEGRLSIFEPINSFCAPSEAEPERLWGFDMTGLEETAAKAREEYRRHQPDLGPMTDFDERDLLAHARAAGFDQIRLDYRAEIGYDHQPVSAQALLRSAPNPLVPTLGEILDAALTKAERETLTARLEREIGAGRRRLTLAYAYLTATRG